MKVGVVKTGTQSLDMQLIENGHSVLRYLPEGPNVPELDHINAFKDNVIYCSTTMDLVANKADVVLVGEDYPVVYEMLKDLGIPVVGVPALFVGLEHDRVFAKALAEKYLKVPKTWTPRTKAEAREIIKERGGKLVLKLGPLLQTPEGPTSDFRTVVPTNEMDLLDFLDLKDFFNQDYSIILEDLIEGVECAYGAWFNGKEFVLPYYLAFEHKAAANNKRGGVLTPEVGTLIFHEYWEDSKIWKLLRQFEPYLKGRFNCIFDINTILDKDGNLWFLEFTPRLGVPTIEEILSVTKDPADLLMRVASGTSGNLDISNDFVCGVCAFTYGCPMPMSEVEVEPHIVGLDKAVATGAQLKIMQSKIKEQEYGRLSFPIDWSVVRPRPIWNERSFIINGIGKTCAAARKQAYDAMSHVNYWSMFYRDDIGTTWDNDKQLLLKYGYINQERADK